MRRFFMLLVLTALAGALWAADTVQGLDVRQDAGGNIVGIVATVEIDLGGGQFRTAQIRTDVLNGQPVSALTTAPGRATLRADLRTKVDEVKARLQAQASRRVVRRTDLDGTLP